MINQISSFKSPFNPKKAGGGAESAPPPPDVSRDKSAMRVDLATPVTWLFLKSRASFETKFAVTARTVTKTHPFSGMHVNPKLAKFCDFVQISYGKQSFVI